MTFDFSEPSTCIQELAEITGYQWYVDFNKAVHFYWNENVNSPLNVGGTYGPATNTLDIDNEIKYAYGLELTEDSSQVKNKILVKNANFQGEFTNEDFVEAQSKFFNFFYDIFPFFSSSSSQSERAASITVEIYDVAEDGTLVLDTSRPITTILLDEVEGKAGDATGDINTVFVNFGKGIRLPDNFPLGDGQVMKVYYYKVESIPIIEMDQESIDDMKAREGGNSTGIYEYPYDASAIYTEKGEELTAAVDRVLLRYKSPLWTGTFMSRLRGWKAGQRFILKGNRWGETSGEAVDEIVWVRDVSKTILNYDMIEYVVSFSSSPFGD